MDDDETGYCLFGVPIPYALGELLEEILDTSWMTRIVWMTAGVSVALVALLIGFYLSYA